VDSIQPGKTRTVFIQFRDRILKNMVMESVSKLKHADEKYNRIILTHDMATEDREEYKRVSQFPPLQVGAAFSCPASSCLAFSASPPGYIIHHNIQNKGERGVVIGLYVSSIVLTWKVYL